MITRNELVKLTYVPNLGPKKFNKIVTWLNECCERLGHGDNYCYKLDWSALLDKGINLEDVQIELEQLREQLGKAVLQPHGAKEGVLLPTDESYPEALKRVADPPKRLLFKGDLAVLKQHTLAIVGTRGATEFGYNETDRLVKFCAYYKIATISGLALGIDTAVHKRSLVYNTPTVAVLPGSIEKPYPPANRDLAAAILKSGGLLLAEDTSTETADDNKKYTFPRRNRIIAALGQATCVIEAPRNSGSLITAYKAESYAKPVFASFSNIHFANMQGNLQLIDNINARPLTASYKQLKEELGLIQQSGLSYNRHLYDYLQSFNLTEREKSLLNVVRSGTQSLDSISESAKEPDLHRLSNELAKLQLSGVISRDKYGQFSANI